MADWDETATVSDTTEVLASLAAAKNPGTVPDFAHYSRLYLQAYGSYTQLQLPRDTMAEESAFQKGLHAIELSSICALEKNRYFKNITLDDLAAWAPKVQLRPGFVEMMRGFVGIKIILSVNWCRKLIEKVLLLNGLSEVKVFANDFEYDPLGTSTGRFDESMSIRTGYDKLLWLNQIRESHQDCSLAYVGDSSGDVLPILLADIGILIEGGRGLAILQHLTNVLPVEEMQSNGQNCAYRGTWEEIAQVL